MATGTGRYAEGTVVPMERSQEEAKKILVRYGATGFGVLQDLAAPGWDTIIFSVGGAPCRHRIQQPKDTTPKEQQAYRTRWRCFCLYLKAVLEYAATTNTPIQEAMLTYVVLPDGRTVGEAAPQIESRGWAGLLGSKQ